MKKAFLLAFSLVFAASLFAQKSRPTISFSVSSGQFLERKDASYRSLISNRMGLAVAFPATDFLEIGIGWRVHQLTVVGDAPLAGLYWCGMGRPEIFTTDLVILETPITATLVNRRAKWSPVLSAGLFFSGTANASDRTSGERVKIYGLRDLRPDAPNTEIAIGLRRRLGARFEATAKGAWRRIWLRDPAFSAHEFGFETAIGYRF